MSIESNEAHVSIDFKYTSENDDVFYVKYHYQNDNKYISLSQDEERWQTFPASLFSEVTDFLRQKNVLGNTPVAPPNPVIRKASPNAPPSAFPGHAVPQTPSSFPGGLPIPSISNAPSASQPTTTQAEAAHVDVAPIQSFNATSEKMQQISAIANQEAPIQPNLTPQEEEEMNSRPVVRVGDNPEAIRSANSEKSIKRT